MVFLHQGRHDSIERAGQPAGVIIEVVYVLVLRRPITVTSTKSSTVFHHDD